MVQQMAALSWMVIMTAATTSYDDWWCLTTVYDDLVKKNPYNFIYPAIFSLFSYLNISVKNPNLGSLAFKTNLNYGKFDIKY